MRIKWDNFGKGLEAIGDAMMTRDAEKLLNRKQTEHATYGGLTPEDVGRIDTANSAQAAADNAEFGTNYDARDYQYGPQDRKQTGLEYEYAGERRSTPLAEKEVRSQNRQAAIDYWTTKGTFGKEGLKTLSDEESAESRRETSGLQRKSAQLSIEEAERKATDAKAMQAFGTEFSQLENPTQAQVRELAKKHSLSPGAMFDLSAKFTGMEKNEFELRTLKRADALNDAFRSGGVHGLKKLFNSGPLFGDGQNAEVEDLGKGKVRMTVYGQKLEGTPASVAERAIAWAKDPIAAAKLERDIEKHTADVRLTEKRGDYYGGADERARVAAGPRTAAAVAASTKAETARLYKEVDGYTKIGDGSDKTDVPEVRTAYASAVRSGMKSEKVLAAIAEAHATAKTPADFRASMILLEKATSAGGRPAPKPAEKPAAGGVSDTKPKPAARVAESEKSTEAAPVMIRRGAPFLKDFGTGPMLMEEVIDKATGKVSVRPVTSGTPMGLSTLRRGN